MGYTRAVAFLLAATFALARPVYRAARMVDGILAYLDHFPAPLKHPSRDRLAEILGVVDKRVQFSTLDETLLTRTKAYSVYRVRWPALDGVFAEGLHFKPLGKPVGRAVAIPDADQTPEASDIGPRLAAQGYEVLALAILNRSDTYSGNPNVRMTNQPHREFLYRMAFPLGRHIIGYEVEKILSAVDWFAGQPSQVPIVVWGYGEGGMLALDAAALDSRIATAVVSGYFGPREALWQEPIFRNVWSFKRDFGDAELAAMIAPRKLIVETREGPRWDGPSQANPQRKGAAPGKLAPASPELVRSEVDRARSLGANIEATPQALPLPAPPEPAPKLTPPPERTHRQFDELVAYTQRLLRESQAERDRYWANTDMKSSDEWLRTTAPYRERIWNDMIGRLPAASVPMNARQEPKYSGAKWDGFDVTLDVFPDVFAYGVLLVPKDLKPGERRPVVVCQHGLEDRPQSMFDQPKDSPPYKLYQNIGNRLADLGFIVYMPQNPYIGGDRFRWIQRKANPLGLSLFSFILAQQQRLLEWLAAQPYVDASRIGFYGLSYGGKTALRVPPLLDGYALAICSGDFNEWVVKLASYSDSFSYLYTGEWEMDEWNLAHVASHAELARLMAPRPFMVERGHRDPVGVDEWVSYEYARVRRFYDEIGLGDRSRIEFFNGPHQIHGVGTVEFLETFLRWPQP